MREATGEYDEECVRQKETGGSAVCFRAFELCNMRTIPAGRWTPKRTTLRVR